MRKTRSDVIFDVIVYTILGLLLLIVIYPLYFVVIASISDPILVTTGRVLLYPKGVNIDGYKKVIEYSPLWVGYRNTLFYVISKTALSTFLTLMAGYALSRKYMIGRGVIMGFMTFTMFFSGGLVPTYLLVGNLGLIGNPAVIVILGCVSVYNVIVTRTFMSSTIPDELWEAASIDGSTIRYFFFKCVLPLSPAIIAVLVLWNAVGEWNSWFNAMIYLRDENHMPLQMVLKTLLASTAKVMESTDMIATNDEFASQALLAETMKYALIIVSTLPIMCAYPFLQKYFVKGVMIGSIKG